jgi:hypothetical protein
MPVPTDVETTVRNLLEVAGLSLSEEQIAMYVRIYPKVRAAADGLFAIPEVRYEQPAVIYPAAT